MTGKPVDDCSIGDLLVWTKRRSGGKQASRAVQTSGSLNFNQDVN